MLAVCVFCMVLAVFNPSKVRSYFVVRADSGAASWLVVRDGPAARGSSPKRGEPSGAAAGGWLDARAGGIAYRH